MLNVEPVVELKLTSNHKLKFHWHPRNNSLFVELQEPTTDKHGHNYGFVDGVTLQGAELRAFAEAIAALNGSEREPTA